MEERAAAIQFGYWLTTGWVILDLAKVLCDQ
jgi:hypothetical protein